MSEEETAEFEVWCDGVPVASVNGPRSRAIGEAKHYAFMYQQDGPVKIYEVTRKEVEL